MSVWAVIGGDGWGEVLAERLGEAGHAVKAATASGKRALREALAAAERLVVTSAPAHLEATLEAMTPHLQGNHRIVTTARGLTPETHLRASEAVYRLTCVRQVAVLAGAAKPEDLRRGDAVALVVGSAFPVWAAEVQEAFGSGSLRVYTNPDLVGVELANALAAILGVAMGAARAHGVGAATEATALTRAVAEMERLVAGLGGRPGTAYGLAGLGVLSTLVFEGGGEACRAGRALARGESVEEFAELADAARTLAARAGQKRLRAPMVGAVAAMFSGKLSAAAALEALMSREARAETN